MAKGLKVKSAVKAGGIKWNHSEAPALSTKPQKGRGDGLNVKTAVKAGGPVIQHSEAPTLKVRTHVKAGGWKVNHSEAAVLGLQARYCSGVPPSTGRSR